MADLDDIQEGKTFGPPPERLLTAFQVKGAGGQDWGLRSRLSRVFRPEDGRTVMLAFDHGYFQGPTSGLERLDLNIVPLVPQADAIMLTRGALRTTIPPQSSAGVVLRATGGPSILKELSNEEIAVSIDDAVRLDVAALAVQVFIGGEFETKSIKNLTTLVDQGQATGIPVMAVTAVGRDLVKDARYIRLATRMTAELGANFVKTYYVEDGFETVTASCPVPIIIAGGKKIPEEDALILAYKAIQEGAAGVDMGRNVFQSDHSAAILTAIRAIVHDGLKPDEAFEVYQELAHS
jgi:3-hydroxy-5-phosphonooxypentane-2,4-dione thiolase